MNESSQLRTYDPASCVVFRKTNERFGGLSNMAAGFPLRVNGVAIRTSEALYQACRFPHMPEVQRLIIGENSPMTAKMRGKPYRDQSRDDWNIVRTKIMRWCLRVKLAQNWRGFGDLLMETGVKPIVEYSSKDDFWGARPQEDGSLQGMNVLGRLLMELREQIRSGVPEDLRAVEPLPLDNFLLYGKSIEAIGPVLERERIVEVRATPAQGSLFGDAPPQAREEPKTGVFSEPTSIAAPKTDTLLPYPQMWASGLDWLGAIPADWQVRRIKAVLKEFDQRSGTGDEPLLSLRMQAGMVDHHKSGGKLIPPDALTHYKVVEPGDIVMNRMRAAMGLFGIAPDRGLVSPDYATFHTIGEIHRPYLVQLFKSPMMAAQFRVESKGLGTGESGFLRLYTDRFGIIRIPIPTIDEQKAIVRFLDWHGAQVSRLVRAKKRSIALIAEERTSLVEKMVRSEAVMTERLGVVVDQTERWIARDAQTEYQPVGLYNRGRGIFHKPPCLGADLGDSTFHSIQEGDLVISGQFAWEGAVALAWSEDVNRVASHRYYCLRGKPEKIENAYLYALFQTAFGNLILNHHSRGAAGRNRPLNIRTLLKEKIPVPGIQAQKELTEFVTLERRMIHETGRFLAYLHEYRTRLIADVVTGKLDVRVLADALPDTPAEELVALDDEPSDDELLEDAESDEEAAA